MKKRVPLSIAITAVLLAGCAARVTPGAETVQIVTTAPNPEKCTFLGEVVGSQGNFITGDVTPTRNLIKGARNKLRNEAYELGGNVVHIQDMQSSRGEDSLGTTNTTAVGNAYKCTQ